MRLVIISDNHSNLPPSLPRGDYLIIGGDLEPDNSPMGQADWYDKTFRKWIEKIRPNYKQVYLMAGNHSFALESYHYRLTEESHQIAKIIDSLPVIPVILTDIMIDGYLFCFNSYCPKVGFWGFGWLPDDYARWCEKRDKCDVLVCHGPPKGMLDAAYRYMPDGSIGHEATGSPELASWVMRVKPRLVCVQHIHESAGSFDINHYDGSITTVVNTCQVTRSLQYIHRPIEIFLPERS